MTIHDTTVLSVTFETSERLIARGSAGDCCLLCGRSRVALPVDHGCRPDLPTDQLARVLAPPSTDPSNTWDAQWATKVRRTVPTATGAASSSPAGVQGRLEGILRTLRAATQGQRNSTLHWCACRVGEMLAAGELHDPRRAADALATVALAVGLEAGETAGTIGSGFDTYGVAV